MITGINENRGQRICLRLRYPGDQNQFLPLEQVVDTMLHELSHNVHGPHDAKFHALWDQLRKEYEGLLSKGYTGEGFLSDGKRLGGRRVPVDEARRIARAAAEKRRTLYSGSGQKLGGAPVRVGTDIRKVIVDAIERRNTVLKGCGSENKNDKEIKDLADQATQSGFKTKAEEDEANDRAIAQALWELVQEDQKKEYGDSYIPATPTNPTGNGGGDISPRKPIKTESSSSAKARAPPTRPGAGHVSRLVSEGPAAKKAKPIPKLAEEIIPVRAQSALTPAAAPKPAPTGWTCPICTLHNPINFLSCDACTTERPVGITKQLAEDAQSKVAAARKPTSQIVTWKCSMCSTIMGDEWWTCSTCGKMKESSSGEQKAVIL
jgi:hypothetical protein